MKDKSDCFALKGEICTALLHKNCPECVFYKSAAQMEKERNAVKKRLERLNEK